MSDGNKNKSDYQAWVLNLYFFWYWYRYMVYSICTKHITAKLKVQAKTPAFLLVLCFELTSEVWQQQKNSFSLSVSFFLMSLCVRKRACISNMTPPPKAALPSQSAPYCPAWSCLLLPKRCGNFDLMSLCRSMWCVSVLVFWKELSDEDTMLNAEGKSVSVCVPAIKMAWSIQNQCVCMH